MTGRRTSLVGTRSPMRTVVWRGMVLNRMLVRYKTAVGGSSLAYCAAASRDFRANAGNARWMKFTYGAAVYETNSIGRAPAAITEAGLGDIEWTPVFRLTSWYTIPRVISHGAFRCNDQAGSAEKKHRRNAKRSQKDSSARAAVVD